MRLESILNSTKDGLASEAELDIAVNMYTTLSKERGIPTSVAFKIENCYYTYCNKPMSLIFKSYVTLQDDSVGVLCQIKGNEEVGLLVIKSDLSRHVLVKPIYKDIEVLSIDCYDILEFDGRTCLINSDEEKGYEQTYYDDCKQMEITADMGNIIFKVYYNKGKVCKGVLLIVKDTFIVESRVIKPVDIKVRCKLLYDAISDWDASDVSEEERKRHLDFLGDILANID